MIEYQEVQLGFFERNVVRLVRALIPSEGLLTVILTLAAVFCASAAIIDAEWIPDLLYVTWVGFLSVLLTIIIIKQPIPPWRGLLYLLGYGAIITLAAVGQLVPNILFWFDRPAALQHFQTQWATLFDRLIGWWRTVSSGGTSRDTIVFALAITVLIWLVAAYVTWATFHKRSPLTALTLVAFALACNSYFSGASSNWLVIFITVLIGLTAQMRLLTLERHWTRNKIDYSREIYFDLLISVVFVGMFIATVSVLMPRFSIRRVASAFQNSAIVLQVEDSLERAFGGVNAPRRPDGGSSGSGDGATGGAASAGRGAGVLPRSYLIGDAPELYETIVMTATLSGDSSALAQARHWRALSYDFYTGSGWGIRDERQQLISAETPFPFSQPTDTTIVTASINWVDGTRATRYTLGLPITFNQDVNSFWRGSDDFVRAQAAGNVYLSQSLLSTASPAELRTAQLAAVPPVIIRRYTELPDDLPQRVFDLALEITADANTPYDKARAIERFLRQYDYSLDISPPPSDVDIVDYFLFESQVGYCDYYATAMTVLARAAGLPARMAAGYAATPLSANNQQTLRQINGHSWSEVYLAEYGWIEFEPTASFTQGVSGLDDGEVSAENAPTLPIVPTAIPQRSDTIKFTLPLLGFSLLTLSLILRFGRRQPDSLERRYTRLHHYAQALQVPTFLGQTTAEFQAALDATLSNVPDATKLLRVRTRSHIEILRREALQNCEAYARELYHEESAELPSALLLNRRFDCLLVAIRLLPQNFLAQSKSDSPQSVQS